MSNVVARACYSSELILLLESSFCFECLLPFGLVLLLPDYAQAFHFLRILLQCVSNTACPYHGSIALAGSMRYRSRVWPEIDAGLVLIFGWNRARVATLGAQECLVVVIGGSVGLLLLVCDHLVDIQFQFVLLGDESWWFWLDQFRRFLLRFFNFHSFQRNFGVSWRFCRDIYLLTRPRFLERILRRLRLLKCRRRRRSYSQGRLLDSDISAGELLLRHLLHHWWL